MQENLKTKDIPERKKVLKPWGSEYTIYSNKISSTKLLKLNSNQSTSLHCHPIKKTGFISRKVQEINLNSVETVVVNEGIIDRIFKTGSIIATGRGTQKILFAFIDNPTQVRELIKTDL